MAVAKGLPKVDTFFMQACPLCGTKHRMMIRGNFVDEKGVWHRYPDMGYSFCNCRNIFYTKWADVTDKNTTWNTCEHIDARLKFDYEHGPIEFTISMLDPYFINWSCPHEMWHWLVRKIYILIDMDSFADMCREAGFEVVSAIRDMDVASKTPQNFHVTVRRNA